MIHINLNFLRTFMLVAEHGSFRRAAEEICRSQSAVGMQIRQIEEELGVALFHRTTRKMELTGDGTELMACARKALDALDELEKGIESIQKAAAARKGQISVACVPTFASAWLPRVLAAFERLHPEVAVRVRESFVNGVFEAVQKQEVDFGIGPKLEGAADFDFDPFADMGMCAMLPARYALPGRTEISVEELSRLPIATQRASESMQAWINQAFEDQGVALTITHNVQQVQTAIALAEGGVAVALWPRRSIPDNVPNVQIVDVPDLPPITLSIITRRGEPLSGMARELRDIVHKVTG